MRSTNGVALRRLALTVAACLPLAARAADRPVRMQVPPPAGDAAAMPVIADPVDDAERRINAAAKRLDAVLRAAMAACKAEGGTKYDWERSVDVTMRGPSFLSYTISDNTYCGGAHPNVSTMAIVYDLRTGSPVDWTRLLPPTWTGTVALARQADGSRVVTLAASRLYALFLAGYDTAHAGADGAECRDAVRRDPGDGPPPMQAWLDAKADGLAVQFDLPHAMAACADPVVIPRATLQAEGAAPALLGAMAAAHGG